VYLERRPQSAARRVFSPRGACKNEERTLMFPPRPHRPFFPGGGASALLALLALLALPHFGGAVPMPENHFAQLKQRLVDDGADGETVDKLFQDRRFRLQPRLLKVNVRQPSGKRGYERFVGDASVRTATSFLEVHRETIERILEGTRVNPEVVVAILKVESGLGTYTGNHRLLNVFATLTLLDSERLTDVAPTFWERVLEDIPARERDAAVQKANQRRKAKARWAYRQLKALMRMAEVGHLDPLEVRGSWAGAYGMPQFLPTSALAYGRDGDGDGVVDLDHLPDAVASVAHYLRIHGYRPDVQRKRRKAVWHYNHSQDYVNCIVTLADRIADRASNWETP
jgi:membrane-bound lytic murein transglycosylase B